MKEYNKQTLLDIIAEKEADIANLHKEIDKLEKYKSYQDMADELKALHACFMNSGFNEEQAFALIKTLVENTMKTTFGR